MAEKTAPKMQLKKSTKAAAEAAETTTQAAATETVAKPAAKAVAKTGVKKAVVEKAAAEAVQETVGTTESQSITDEDQIVSIAKEIETIKEDKAFKLIPSLLEDSEKNQFKIGGLLARVRSEGWFQDKGFEDFGTFVEAAYGIKYRKAMYLIANYNALVTSQVPWDRVAKFGWAKLSEFVKHLTLENMDEWLEEIDGLTTDQIKALVKQKTKGVAAGLAGKDAKAEAAKVTSMTFKLHEDQKATVREALEQCKHQTGTEFDNVAIEHICLEFLGGESKLAKVPSLK